MLQSISKNLGLLNTVGTTEIHACQILRDLLLKRIRGKKLFAQARSSSLDSTDVEAYYFNVGRDETGVWEKGDSIKSSDIESELDWSEIDDTMW